MKRLNEVDKLKAKVAELEKAVSKASKLIELSELMKLAEAVKAEVKAKSRSGLYSIIMSEAAKEIGVGGFSVR